MERGYESAAEPTKPVVLRNLRENPMTTEEFRKRLEERLGQPVTIPMLRVIGRYVQENPECNASVWY